MKCNYFQPMNGENKEIPPPEVTVWSNNGSKLMVKSLFTWSIQGTQRQKNANALMFIRQII